MNAFHPGRLPVLDCLVQYYADAKIKHITDNDHYLYELISQCKDYNIMNWLEDLLILPPPSSRLLGPKLFECPP